MNEHMAMRDAPFADDTFALPAVIDEFLMLVSETACYHQTPAVSAVMREAQRILLTARRRLRMASGRYVVAVVGLTNVGKSTLLNALLGDELAPRRNGPCTAAAIEFAYGSQRQVSVRFREGLQRPRWHCASSAEVRQRLEALADDAGAEASHTILRVNVELPCPLLTDGLVIADTPGFGAAQQADSTGTHEQALRDYLSNGVSQVFWVVLAEQGIGKSEMSFHDRFFADVCNDVIITGCEDWDPPDRTRFRRRFSQFFGRGLPRFHFVSGLEGLRARQSHDDQQLDKAGIPALEQRIREMAIPAGRTTAIGKSILALAADLRAWLIDHGPAGESSAAQWWRPDSWDRFLSAATLGEFATQVARHLEVPA